MERNYIEDQTNEIEALESIYYNDFEGRNQNCQYIRHFSSMMKIIRFINIRNLIFAVISTSPHKFNIQISTEDYDAENESNGLACKLVFTYTEKYPDTAPLVEIDEAVNFEDEFEPKLLEHINETVSLKWQHFPTNFGQILKIAYYFFFIQ